MIHLERGGLTLTEFRRQGVTINDQLRSWQRARTQRVLLWKQKPELPSVQPPDLYFEEITYFRASSPDDQNFVVAVGRDEDRFTLVINDKIAINERLAHLGVARLFKEATGLTLFCETKDHTGKVSLIHLQEHTGITPILEDQDRISEVQSVAHPIKDQGYRIARRVVGVDNNATTFVYYKDSGEILRRFSVEKSLEVEDIDFYETNEDFTTVWSLPEEQNDENDEVEGEAQAELYTYYRDSELIAEHVLSNVSGEGAIVFNSDLSSFISVERNKPGGGPRVKIQRDGEVLGMTDHRCLRIYANKDLSSAAVEFAITTEHSPYPQSVLFYITPDKQGWTDLYDGDGRAVLDFLDDSIIVDYRRNGIFRRLKIPSGQGSNNPEETTIEQSVA